MSAALVHETSAEEVARLRAAERITWIKAGSTPRMLANFDKRTQRLIECALEGDALRARNGT